MLIKQFKQLPIALVLTTGAGLLMHDTQVDQVFANKVDYSASSFNSSTAGRSYKHDDSPHLHLERPIYERGSVPKSQTRLSDDKKYIVQKRLAGSNNDFDYIWPSV